MDFLDPKKKKAYNFRLALGFILIGFALILGTIILALITAGYGLNRKTGQVIQNGLVFVSAHPQAASIYINGVNHGTTNSRLELPAGSYNFELTRSGYGSWSNTIQLVGGTVEQLDYPFLFPTKPISKSVLSLSSQPEINTETPNQQTILVSVPGQEGSFSVVDATNPSTPITTTAIPSSVLGSQPGSSLQFVEWANDNQFVLLKHTFSGGSDFIMFNYLTPSSSFNVNQTFPNANFDQVQLVNKLATQLFLLNSTNGTLVDANVSAKTTTQVLTGALAYWPYGTNEILYTTADSSNPALAQVKLWLNDVSYNLRTIPVSSTYLLNIANYNSHFYVVVGSGASQNVYIYKDPQDQLASDPKVLPVPYTLLIIKGAPEQATFSSTARFLEVQSGDQFSTYDFEGQQHYRFTSNLPLAPGELANWMDGNRLELTSGDKLNIFDFDGTNLVQFVSSSTTFSPNFNQAYTAVYSTVPIPGSPNGAWQLVRTSLIAGSYT